MKVRCVYGNGHLFVRSGCLCALRCFSVAQVAHESQYMAEMRSGMERQQEVLNKREAEIDARSSMPHFLALQNAAERGVQVRCARVCACACAWASSARSHGFGAGGWKGDSARKCGE